MIRNVFDIESYTPKREDKLFFDANIWLYLFSPLGNYKRQVIKKYDSFLKKAIQVKASIFISSLVLSEFFNAYVKMEFNILKEKYPRKYKDFKKNFQNTREYAAVVNQIKTTINARILRVSVRINDGFDKIDLEKIFNGIEKTGFNDRYYQELALGRRMKIVTHDYDFVKTGKDVIITANPRALKSR